MSIEFIGWLGMLMTLLPGAALAWDPGHPRRMFAISLVASVLWMVYAWLVSTTPVFVLNLAMIVINIIGIIRTSAPTRCRVSLSAWAPRAPRVSFRTNK